MKVALISRSSLFTVKGGDTTQVIKTAEGLTTLGIRADVFLSTDQIDYGSYDLIHYFNIVRPADHLYHIRKSHKPYVVSTIYLDYTAFDRYGRGLLYSLLFRAAGRHGAEYLKNAYRFLRRQDALVSRNYLLGHLRAMRKILSGAALILPNSVSEYNRLSADTGYKGRYAVIPNGIDPGVFGNIPDSVSREDKVICVAQVYGMKNQHALILACRKLGIPLEIIGKAPPNHAKYYEYCRKIGGSTVRFHDYMPHEALREHYASAKVHALPSWFETTGLTSLEAGAMGCNLVMGTGGDTRDYFGDLAWYCDPRDQESLESALKNALSQKSDHRLRERILTEFTWQKAAEKTMEAYQQALNER